MTIWEPGVTNAPTRAGSDNESEIATCPSGTWIAFCPNGVVPNRPETTNSPGVMSVSATSLPVASSTVLNAPAGRPLDATCVGTINPRATASAALVPDGTSLAAMNTVCGR